MSNDDNPHSGSRWEPAPEAAPTAPAGRAPEIAPAATIAAPAGDQVTAVSPVPTVHHAPPPWPVLLPAVPASGRTPSAPRRRNLRRLGLVAAAAAGLLAVGGAGGYAIGHATAGGGPAGAAGLAGLPGEHGHHRGQVVDGVPRDRAGDGDDSSGPSAPGGTGSSGTATST